jgi:hypothetical protein
MKMHLLKLVSQGSDGLHYIKLLCMKACNATIKTLSAANQATQAMTEQLVWQDLCNTT